MVGSAAPPDASLARTDAKIQAASPPDINIEVRAGLARLLDPPEKGFTKVPFNSLGGLLPSVWPFTFAPPAVSPRQNSQTG
jgi:hypothetical protein